MPSASTVLSSIVVLFAISRDILLDGVLSGRATDADECASVAKEAANTLGIISVMITSAGRAENNAGAVDSDMLLFATDNGERA